MPSSLPVYPGPVHAELRRGLSLVVLVACLAGCESRSDPPIGPEVRDAALTVAPRQPLNLGTFGGESYATDVNDLGHVAGWSRIPPPGNHWHAFYWNERDGMVDLGTLGGMASQAFAINNLGQVVGRAVPSTSVFFHAFVWSAEGGMVDIGTLPGNQASSAHDINDRGQIVGSSGPRAFIWSPSTGMVDIGHLGGGSAFPTAINEAGQVVGSSRDINGDTRAFLWSEADGMRDLGTLGGSDSEATDIDAHGHVVGRAMIQNRDYHAFFWTPEGMVDLGTLGGRSSGALGVNDRHEVVGWAQTEGGRVGTKAFVWTRQTGLRALSGLGGSAHGATAINERGQISGAASLPLGGRTAVLWSRPRR